MEHNDEIDGDFFIQDGRGVCHRAVALLKSLEVLQLFTFRLSERWYF